MARLNPPRPLDDQDDVDGFDCGRESMNQWFRRHVRVFPWSATEVCERLLRENLEVGDCETKNLSAVITLVAAVGRWATAAAGAECTEPA